MEINQISKQFILRKLKKYWGVIKNDYLLQDMVKNDKGRNWKKSVKKRFLAKNEGGGPPMMWIDYWLGRLDCWMGRHDLARQADCWMGRHDYWLGRLDCWVGRHDLARQAWLLIGQTWLLAGQAWLLNGQTWLLAGQAWLLNGKTWPG